MNLKKVKICGNGKRSSLDTKSLWKSETSKNGRKIRDQQKSLKRKRIQFRELIAQSNRIVEQSSSTKY